MTAYEPTRFVEPIGYQPVEFLDLPSMSEARTSGTGASKTTPAFPETDGDLIPETVTIVRQADDVDQVDRLAVAALSEPLSTTR